MIKELLAPIKKVHRLKSIGNRLFFSCWLVLQRKSQRTRIKKAKTILKRINQDNFKENPGQLFSYIRKIDAFVFEEVLLLALRYRGFKVIHNKRYTGDGGIDGIVIVDNKRYAIQAKRYSTHINSSHINDFKVAITKHRCAGGFFIHCGRSGAGLYTNLNDTITLISGKNLHKLLILDYA